MNTIIKKILNTLETNGYEAYLVGGYVRDYLLGINSQDVDICTNALPKAIYKLFKNAKVNNYGGINLKIDDYNFDITTYRKELKYENRKPIEIVYINSLEEDVLRRDFTINAICMDKNGKIIDLVNGINDLNNRVIKMIDNNILKRIEEDPLRILRCVRVATVIDFTIDENLYKIIKENHKLVKSLTNTKIKQELNKILLSENYLKGLNYLKDLNILDDLEIKFTDIHYVNDICGMWAQLDIQKNFAFTKQEFINIINIKEIIEGGFVTKLTLYNYGLYNSLVAASILDIPKKEIMALYNDMPIKKVEDLALNNQEIINIVGKNFPKIKNIKTKLIKEILSNNLKNRKEDLIKYIEKS